MFSAALDWPLSREEKKGQLLRLYNEDVRTADSMLCSGNKALEALREELDAVRSAAGVHKDTQKIPAAATPETSGRRGGPSKNVDAEVERLRQAVESAAAVLRAILPSQDDEDAGDSAGGADGTPTKSRARSEGASREVSAVALRPALRPRTPRNPGRPKRRVSFGSQPEEEPAHDPEVERSDLDGEDTKVILNPQWTPVDSMCSRNYAAPSSGHNGYPWPCSMPGSSGPASAGYGHGIPSQGFAPPGWGAMQGAPYIHGHHHHAENMDIFVEVAPQVQPSLQRSVNGTFEMSVPGVTVKLLTNCNPMPQQYPYLPSFKPFEEFNVALPEVQRVIFDPQANMPPNGRVWCQVHKRGAVIELPPHITMNAKLKTDSPFGSFILRDMGETVLNYRLQVDGRLALGKGNGNMGANRLEVELNFIFDCYIGGPPVAQSNPGQQQSCHGSSYSSLSGSADPGQGYASQGYGHSWIPSTMPSTAVPFGCAEQPEKLGRAGMQKSASEGRLSMRPFYS